MQSIRILAIAAAAAFSVMAFIGASTASANTKSVVLCKDAELICENGAGWPNPTTISAHATSPKLLSSVGTMECPKSLIGITLLNKLSTLISSNILALEFEGSCHLGPTKCTFATNEVGGLSFVHGPLSLEAIATGVASSGGFQTTFTVHCSFLVNCTYGLGGVELVAHSSGTGELTLVSNEAEITEKVGVCPEITRWDATYVGLGGGLYIES
jgi:hypothetical protein